MGETVKILLKEPEEIRSQKLPPQTPTASAMCLCWEEGKQAVLDQMVDVDLSKMAVNWLLDEVCEIGEVASGKIIVKGKPFEEYLKEQLEVKHG